jgi:hypothetical protein
VHEKGVELSHGEFDSVICLSCCPRMPFVSDRIFMYILMYILRILSEAPFMLPQRIVFRVSDIDYLILQDLPNNRSVYTYLHTYIHIHMCAFVYVCVCVRARTKLVD